MTPENINPTPPPAVSTQFEIVLDKLQEFFKQFSREDAIRIVRILFKVFEMLVKLRVIKFNDKQRESYNEIMPLAGGIIDDLDNNH